MPQTYDFDLFTIGAGSGGVRASRIAAGYGAKVAVAEERYLGGTCVNVGCIPKKLLVYASEFSEAFEDAAGFGWDRCLPPFDWRTLVANKDREIERLNGVYERLLTGAGAEIMRHRAQLLDAHTIVVNGKRVTTRYILIATGSWPTMLPIPGAELMISSNEAFHLSKLPARILIIGGGYIGVEFAGILRPWYARDAGPPGIAFPARVRRRPASSAGSGNAQTRDDVHFDTMVTGIERTAGGVVAALSSGAQLEVDLVMCCTGRHPNSAGLGLEQAGVKVSDNGAIVVNEYSQTLVDNIYAIGDVTNRRNLTPVAIAEGHAVADLLFGGRSRIIDHESVPSAVFSQPPIATVGLTEAEARTRYDTVEIYKSAFPALEAYSQRPRRTGLDETCGGAEKRTRCRRAYAWADAGEIIRAWLSRLDVAPPNLSSTPRSESIQRPLKEFVTMREKS